MNNILLDKVKIRDNRQLLNKGEIEEIIDKKANPIQGYMCNRYS